MAGQDPSRFDYLFEPVDGDTESAADGDAGVIVDAPVRSRPKRQWSWLAVVVATILGAGVGLTALWSGPVDAVQAPSDVTTTAPPPVSTSRAVVAPASEGIPPPTPAPEPTVDVVPLPEAEPAPQPAPPSAAPAAPPAPAVRPPTPVVRSPMSVSPEPRPAFPNQQVPDGDGGRGGLLGGGGLL